MHDIKTSLPQTFRGWVCRGGSTPADLRLETLTLAPPGFGEVLVRNAAVGLNPVDWKVLSGQHNKVPGVDGAGTVVAVGEGVASGWIGQRVAYHQNLRRPGSFAEYTALSARVVLRLPDALDFLTAAGFPCPGLTAWQALDKLPLGPGQSLLVSGAGGAVGGFLVQLAVARGLEVTALCNPRHWERLTSMGVRACLPGPLGLDERWPSGRPVFHAVVDSVSAEHANKLVPALRANGHIVCIQGRLPQWPNEPFGRALSMHEVALGALHIHGDGDDWSRLIHVGEGLLQQIVDGSLQCESAVVREFTELPELLGLLQYRQFSGKPLLRLA